MALCQDLLKRQLFFDVCLPELWRPSFEEQLCSDFVVNIAKVAIDSELLPSFVLVQTLVGCLGCFSEADSLKIRVGLWLEVLSEDSFEGCIW